MTLNNRNAITYPTQLSSGARCVNEVSLYFGGNPPKTEFLGRLSSLNDKKIQIHNLKTN